MKKERNLIGPTVRKLRYKQKLSQTQLAARCQLHAGTLRGTSLPPLKGRFAV